MTGNIGKLAGAALLIGLLLGSAALKAEVSSAVDRQQVSLGDTLRLTISATEDDEDISGIDLSHLRADFEVLQQSTQSNTRIINGQRSHNRLLIVEITPRREGTLTIPAFRVGSAITDPIAVAVSKAPKLDPGSDPVLFEAELDREQVYVQGQLILTLRLQQSINLDRRSISELALDNAFVLPLEQQSFQRTVDGRPWLVHEVRYAIFPEQSGTLEIPAQSFTARESRPRRSLFDAGGDGRLVRRNTPALKVNVLPRPADYPASATWLPAQAVTLEESWSADPATLRAGESITRTIEMRGTGVQGAQLPPFSPGVTDGLKYFPDQPSITDSEISTGILGSRRDSVAIVPTRAGKVVLPELRVPWWDTEAGEMRVATLPAHEIDIAPAAVSVPVGAPVPIAGSQNSPQAAAVQSGGSPLLWQLLAAGCAIGWLVTVGLFWRNGRRTSATSSSGKDDTNLRTAYNQLLAACASDQAIQARGALITWAGALAGDDKLATLAAVSGLFGDPALDREIESLDRSLFAHAPSSWRGDSLAAAVKRLHREARSRPGSAGESLALYPAA